MTPDSFRAHSQLLDKMLSEVGRTPASVKRTLAAPVFVGRDEAELEQHVGFLRGIDPTWAEKPITEIFEILRLQFESLMWGTPAEVVEQLQRYAEAGVEEVMIQWGAFDAIEGLKLIAEQILPLLRT